MPGHKLDRITEDVRRELSAILREVKDPRVKDCFLSIVRVDVTNDLSYCTVYVSTMEGLDRTKTAVQGLRAQFDKEVAALKEKHEKELAALRGQYELEAITAKV